MKIRGSLLLAVLICANFFACAQTRGIIEKVIQVPTVSLADISVTDISARSMGLLLDLEINNPNPRGLELNALEYQVDLAEKPLFSGVSSEKMSLAANGTSHSKVPVSLSYKDVMAAYDSIKGRDEVPYKISGQAKVNSPIGEIPIPYSFQGSIPVIRPPRISEVSLKIDQLNLTGAALHLNLKIFNPNSFNLDIAGADYSLDLAGNSFSSGNIPSASVPAKSNGALSVPLSINFSGLAGSVYSLLTKGNADYSLNYNASYKIKNRTVIQTESKSGTLKIQR